jgi:hypothetical protein
MTAARVMKIAVNFMWVSESRGQVSEDECKGRSRLLRISRSPTTSQNRFRFSGLRDNVVAD